MYPIYSVRHVLKMSRGRNIFLKEFFVEHHFKDKTNRVDGFLGRVLLRELLDPGDVRILMFKKTIIG